MTDAWTAIGRRVLVVDGAMGTMLHASGMSLDRSLPELNLSNPALVRAIHDSYLAAGADVIQTNTFGASRPRLAAHGHAGQVREINAAGVRLAQEAGAAAGRPMLVAGSVAPAAGPGQRGRIEPAERAAAVAEQVEALVDAGVDLLVFETFGHLDELVEAVGAAAGLGVPVVAQATFADDGRTLGGDSPWQVARALEGLPVAAIGTNCTLGPQGVLGVVRELARHTDLPLSAQPNAGVPRMVGGRRFQYTSDSAYVARYARRYAELGAVLVGGCCGTTPDHIRAVAEAVTDVRPARWPAAWRPARAQAAAADAPPPAGTDDAQRHQGLDERLAAGRFVVAVEVAPPVGGRPEQAAEQADALARRGVDLLAVAPARSARAQMSPMSLALHLRQQARVEPILTVTTWDRSIMALQADLLGAHALGIRSVICRTGSPPLRGDYPNVDGIWEVDSVGLIGLLAGLNRGQDCNGLALDAETSFCVGARFNPNAGDPERELARTVAKIEAGARFLVTWPLHELDGLRAMLAALGDRRVPVLLAATPLRSFGEAEYLRHEVPDVAVPDAVLDAMGRAGDHERDAGLRLTEELLLEAAGLVEGVLLGVPDGPGAEAALDRLLPVAARAAVR